MILSEICKKNNIDLKEEKIRSAIDEVVKITRRNIIKFQGRFPTRVTQNGIYGYQKDFNVHDLWWRGFWGGIIWLAYEYTNDYKIRCYGERITESVYHSIKKSGMGHNDIGMFVILTCIADYRICHNKLAKELVVESADSLLTRYNQNNHILISFDFERDNDVLTLKISGMLNVMLLKYAYNFTGNIKYKEAFQHTVNLITRHNILSDGKTYFNTYFDKLSGKPIDTRVPYIVWEDDGKRTRSYAWALYALANLYSMTHDNFYLERFDKVFDYMKSLCQGDNIFHPEFSEHGPIDTVSPAIMVGAIAEMVRNDEIPGAGKYAEMAAYLLDILIDKYSVKAEEHAEGLLYGAHLFKVTTNDMQSVILSDYFYFEALLSSVTKRKSYWYTLE